LTNLFAYCNFISLLIFVIDIVKSKVFMVLFSMGKINKDDQALIMVIVIHWMVPLYFPKLI